jgi:fructose-1,6-bisphosphatase/inositol monophosphatase family enzyme
VQSAKNPDHPKQQVWDIAPVLLIVEEAGGLVTDPFGYPYAIGTGAPIVVSRNRAVHDQLFDLIGLL